MVRDRRSTLRRGVTLTEVLVAMFVMAIGMISLLTLFPLGAMQVGQALRDDRATQLARQADAFVRDHWRTNVVAVLANPPSSVPEPYFWAMDDPNLVTKSNVAPNTSLMTFLSNSSTVLFGTASVLPTAEAIPTGAAPALVSRFNLGSDTVALSPPAPVPPGPYQSYANFQRMDNGPSYPVMLDLSATVSRPSTSQDRHWVAYTPGSQFRIPRRTTTAVHAVTASAPLTALAFEQGNLLDDMAFLPNGAPVAPTVPQPNGELGRQGRYSWAAVLQRPRNDERTTADLSILVFDKRPALPQPGDETVIAPDVPVAKDTRSVTITLPNRTSDTSPVLLRRGGWIIDGTIDAVPVGDTVAFRSARRNFHAYRVSGFTEVPVSPVSTTTTTYDVDLETPLKADLTGTSQLYLFAGLIEVFTRPQLRPDTNY